MSAQADTEAQVRALEEDEATLRRYVAALDEAKAADPGDDDSELSAEKASVVAKLAAIQKQLAGLRGTRGLAKARAGFPGIGALLDSIDVRAILGDGEDKPSPASHSQARVDRAIAMADDLMLTTFGVGAEEAEAYTEGIESHDVTASESKFAGTFKGYAVEWGSIATPSGGALTTFRKGAFDPLDLTKIRLYRQHDPAQVAGVITALRNTDRGLEMEAAFARTPLGVEVAELVRTGSLRALSVGFIVEKSHDAIVPGRGKVRVVDKATLLEVSVVNHGADARALIVEAASRSGGMELSAGGKMVNWKADVAAAERWRDGDSSEESATLRDYDYDFIRERVRLPGEREEQQRTARMEKMYRALQRDPSLSRMHSAALAEYVDLIG